MNRRFYHEILNNRTAKIADGIMTFRLTPIYVMLLTSNDRKRILFGGDVPRGSRGCPKFLIDRQDACPTAQGGRDSMVGRASSLSGFRM